MNIKAVITLDDVRAMAKRKLPHIAFDFIDGGSHDEHCLRRNREAFQQYRLLPRYLVDVTKRDQSTTEKSVTASAVRRSALLQQLDAPASKGYPQANVEGLVA